MAKQVKTTEKATHAPAAPSQRSLRREQAAHKRRQQALLIGAGAATFILLIALIVFLNIRNQRPVAGEQKLAAQGSYHMEQGGVSPIAYNSTPPTSGPHYPGLAGWRVYTDPQRYETLLHNMEDGGVIVYYQCPDGCADIVQQLDELLTPYLNTGRKVILTPNDPNFQEGGSQPLHQEMGAQIALTAWQRHLTMNEVDAQKIRAFIDRYEGIDHHSG